MRKATKILILSLLLSCFFSVSAQAIDNNMLKVGLRFGSSTMFSANLQNVGGAGLGYEFGYFDSGRSFVSLGAATGEDAISMSVDDNVFISGGVYFQSTSNYTEYIGAYHLQMTQAYASYGDAAAAASNYAGGFVAYLGDRFTVRVGQYRTREGVERAWSAWTGEAAEIVSPSRTGVMVTATGTDRILFYFDCGGQKSLAVMPRSIGGEKPETWFRNLRYYGAFEYPRAAGGELSVINVVNIEDYVKGVIGWEIGTNAPLEATKAQAVAARTYAATRTRHRSQGFDVCATDDCQVYQGLAASSDLTNRAVDETAGVYVYYNGSLAETYFYSSNGGASEDAKNVWGGDVAYLKGKADPYEALVVARIPYKYNWSTTFTRGELESRLAAYGYSVGTLKNVYVSEYTPNGNVYAVTYVGSNVTRTVFRDTNRLMLNLRSLRFDIGGAANDAYYVNGANASVSGLRGVYTISGGGTVSQYGGAASDAYVITSSGTSKLQKDAVSTTGGDTFTFTGSGWGHSIGMSQWGAVAMAEQGKDYKEILQFFYTGVEVR
ncbi:MAG: SpoIID/LytB domain-containing protein, partial [Oscillospiraceae bacterium]|nr:SpoIID/LytB domain-containing protein [Oscillospiraceae bacterium]